MTNDEALKQLTPGELLVLLTKRQSAVDAEKNLEELSIGELMMLKHHEDELRHYKRERMRKLKSELSKEESDEETSVGELIQALYGSRRR